MRRCVNMRVHNPPYLYQLVWIGIAVVVAIGLTSCGGDSKTGPKDDDSCCMPDTPDNLMTALACVYGAKDFEAYEGLLHDEYRFSFMVDIADSLGLPPGKPWWGKTNDLQSTANLLADGNADFSIVFIPVSEGWTPHEMDRGDTVFTGVFRRYIVDLMLEMEEPGTEPINLVGDATYVDVIVVPHPYTGGHFAVLDIEEDPRPPTGAPQACLEHHLSWSEVKARYN
jgi:hypothetical protein